MDSLADSTTDQGQLWITTFEGNAVNVNAYLGRIHVTEGATVLDITATPMAVADDAWIAYTVIYRAKEFIAR